MVTALSSVLALGVLGACGDVENEPLNNDPMNDNGGMNDDMNDDMNNDM